MAIRRVAFEYMLFKSTIDETGWTGWTNVFPVKRESLLTRTNMSKWMGIRVDVVIVLIIVGLYKLHKLFFENCGCLKWYIELYFDFFKKN